MGGEVGSGSAVADEVEDDNTQTKTFIPASHTSIQQQMGRGEWRREIEERRMDEGRKERVDRRQKT